MIDLVAVGMGTDVLEKHITLAREERGVDYQSALEADEFQKYVRDIHAAASSLGDSADQLDEYDIEYRKFQKKNSCN